MLIASCASNAPEKVPSTQAVKKVITAPVEIADDDFIALAEKAWLEDNNINMRNDLLIRAAQQFASNSQCPKTNTVLGQIWPSIENNKQFQQAQLLKAECAILNIDEQTVSLELIQSWLLNVSSPELFARQQIAQAKLAALEANYAVAIRKIIPHMDTVSILNTQSAKDVWAWFSALNNIERHQLVAELPELAPYQTLALLTENTKLTDLSRQQAIQFWRDTHASHPLNIDFPDSISAFTQQTLKNINNITIMLPLSGRLEAQGDAIKQGTITAYLKALEDIKKNDPATPLPRLHFVDTGSDSGTINDEARASEIYQESDLIIGPLLKEHVAEVSRLNINNVPAIFLNRVDSTAELADNALYFSLSPEDEAKQIAKLMIDQGITTPVIINNGGALAERMQSAFISTWESYGALQGIATADGSLLPQITFTDNKSMRIGITSALDVLQSQRRISQMESLGTDVIHSVTRNRRDIDAFVVFALPDQVELINPIIEASISLFSETALPVYASSYSYQHQLNKNSIRDLRNLSFVDMPWLMPEQRNSELAKEVDSVWNQPSSSYLRLFAFGFDSFQFAERFGQLSFFKQNRLQGLSGTLQVNDIQQVVRELPVASVGQDAIEMMK
jgi:outer membrane PBP1 activator LpoA protein